MSEFIKKLLSCDLSTLQESRIYNKLSMFANSIETNNNSLTELESLIVKGKYLDENQKEFFEKYSSWKLNKQPFSKKGKQKEKGKG